MTRPQGLRMRLPDISPVFGAPPGVGVAFALNRLLAGPDLDPLEGKVFVIRVTDLPLTLSLRIRNRRLVVDVPGTAPLQWADVTISGTLRNFMRLALRSEDPDTLFFHRALSMEGDTEAGLYVKNLLDRIEPASEESLALLLGPRLQPLARVLPLSQGLSSLRRVLAAWVQ